MDDTSTTPAGGLRGGAVIAVAMGAMNVATYGYTIVAAHLVGPGSFGAFSALMGVVIVVNVLALGLQATGARAIAAEPHRVAAIERQVLAASVRCGIGLGLLCLALAPLLDVVLRLDSLATAALVAVAAAPLTITGGQSGVLQGERRWEPLALVYLAQGLGRVVVGVGLMAVWPTEFSAMLGVALGAWLPVLIGWVALRRPRGEVAGAPRRDRVGATGVLREVAGSSQALLAFFALSNADILVARAVLDDHDAGLYAGGLILVKAILFLPQFVVVIAFPSMSSKGADRRTLALSLLVSAGLGLGALGGVLLLPDLALLFVGGDQFAEIRSDLWIFALVGTALTMVQLLVYAAIAQRQTRVAITIWSALVVLVVLTATLADGVLALVTLVAAFDLTLFAVLLALTWGRSSGGEESVRGVVPAAAGAHGDVERDGELGRAAHP